MPEDHFILVIDGDGWKPGAIEWLKNAARTKRYTTPENRDKTIEVMTLAEFAAWVNATLTP